jgi:drug/metabolite transporter (DMT)-like permease
LPKAEEVTYNIRRDRPMDKKSRQSLLEIHAATALFGLAGLFGKWIALSPLLIVLGRVFFASLALGAILLAMKQSLRALLRETQFLIIILGAILATHWVAFFRSIQVSSVAVGLLSYSCFPVFTVLLEPVFFQERRDRISLILAVFCLSGVFLIVPRFDPADVVYQGVLWGLFSGLTFAVLALFNRRLSQKHSSLAIAFLEDLLATLFLCPFFFIYRTPLTAKNLFLLIILGIICTAFSHTLFIKGMRFVRAQTASIISSLEPVYGIVLAFFLLREVPGFKTLLGGVIILASVILVSIREGARKN